MSSRTLVEKVIAKAAGLESVSPDQIVVAKVDLAFAHDSSGPRRWQPMLAELGAGLWDPAKIVLVSDHYVPAIDAESAEILRLTRQFAKDRGVGRFFDMEGICHVVMPEHGLIRPGMFIAGGDSHTATAGAFGAFAMGFGAIDMVAIAATGETWLHVPQTLLVELDGRLAPGVTAKDVMLLVCRELGSNNAFRAIEFAGSTVSAMTMSSRMVLTNMSAELGADTAIIAPDSTTFEYFVEHGVPDASCDGMQNWRSDLDAAYEAVHRFDVASLSPQIAAPHSPDNSRSVDEFAGVQIHQAYIGSCAGAKLEDLQMAATILRGRRVAHGVRLLVAPASRAAMTVAAKDGTLAAIVEAGAVLMASGCGACAGMGAGVLADGEVCISSTNRNFKGRMGHPGAAVYLGSPYAVAAAAVAGHICDPRAMLDTRGAGI